MSCLSCKTPAGHFKHRLTVYDPNTAADAEGQMADGTPTSITGIWAKKESVAGGEVRNGMQMETNATHLFTTRYRTDIQHDYYLEDADSVRYDVVRVYDQDGNKTELKIQAKSNPT